jgi:hypothetical protein
MPAIIGLAKRRRREPASRIHAIERYAHSRLSVLAYPPEKPNRMERRLLAHLAKRRTNGT